MNCCMIATYFLKSAFHHIPIAPEDVHQTTIRTPVGAYAFTRTPFGLSTSAQVFQRLIDTVIRRLPFVCAYVHDILIFSKDEKEHLKHLSILFQRLNNFGLTIHLKNAGLARMKFSSWGMSSHQKEFHLQLTGLKQFAIFHFQKSLKLCVILQECYNFIVPLFHTCPTNWHHCTS